MTREAILASRHLHLGTSLSLSYREPLHIIRGEGMYLMDENGRQYLDLVNNVCHVGHCHPHVVEAACRQMQQLNTNTRYLHENIVRYAERLSARFPDPLSVCFFVNSGSEANDLALRLANAATGKSDVVIIDGGYHGNLSSLIGLSAYKFNGPGGEGRPSHAHLVPMPDGYRGLYKHSNTQAGDRYGSQVQQAILSAQKQGRGVSAFLCESILSCGGQIVLPPGFLKEAHRHARRAGAVSIADEVQVGFGRVGSHWWAFETQEVVPDIVTLGKPIGNGHPLGAVVTTPAIAEAFANGMEYFNTFGGNPVSCAVGLAVLDVMEEENLRENALRVGNHLLEGLKALQAEHGIIGEVRGLGLFIGIELVTDRDTLEPAAGEAKKIVEGLKEKGILVSVDGPLHNVLKIKPPMVITPAQADTFLGALHETLAGWHEGR